MQKASGSESDALVRVASRHPMASVAVAVGLIIGAYVVSDWWHSKNSTPQPPRVPSSATNSFNDLSPALRRLPPDHAKRILADPDFEDVRRVDQVLA
jgi:hypothetical protein